LVKTYDAWALELVAQQKCYYHIIRSIDKVLEDKAGSARALGGTLNTLHLSAFFTNCSMSVLGKNLLICRPKISVTNGALTLDWWQ